MTWIRSLVQMSETGFTRDKTVAGSLHGTILLLDFLTGITINSGTTLQEVGGATRLLVHEKA
jgi:hypothetical protein